MSQLQDKYKEKEDSASIIENKEASVSKPKKKFRWKVEDNDSPKEIYNWTLYSSVFVFGILGAARGLDEGSISGSIAQVSFRNLFGFNDPKKSKDQVADLKSNIAAMVQLGSVGGAMLAMFTVDRLGRVNALRQMCVIWIIGAIIQITSKKVGQLYFGRLFEGFAIGQTTTIGPTYLSEVAPRQIRGLCGCIFAGAVYFGIMLMYFTHYGTALHVSNSSRSQWVIPTSLKLVFAGGIFIMTFFMCVESPRWLLKVNRQEDAVKALSKLRNLPEDHPFIIGEISDINEQIDAEREAVKGNNIISLFKEFLLKKANRYRFFVVSAGAQLLGQWSGANAITIYAPELFANVGIRGVEKLKMTAVLGVVKLTSAYISAFFIIDFLGRRTALYIGIVLQLVCELYFAIFMHVVPEASDHGGDLTGSDKYASKGALAALFLSGCGWTMGFNSVQYLLGSEIFPLNIRSFAQSMVMVLHFANQYGNSKALPKMMIAMEPHGAFYFFSAVLSISLFWAWFFVPEVAGRSLESMEEIFNLPWYLIGRKGAQLCPDHSELTRIHYNLDGELNLSEKDKPDSEFHENVSDEKLIESSNSKSDNDASVRSAQQNK